MLPWNLLSDGDAWTVNVALSHLADIKYDQT